MGVLLVCTLAAAVNTGERAPICMLDILRDYKAHKEFLWKTLEHKSCFTAIIQPIHDLYHYGTNSNVILISHYPYNYNPYPTAFPYGNGMVLHFYQQQESSTTKTVHKVINKGLKAYV